jgi:hypothetical protein
MLKGPCVSREFQITLYSPFGDDLLTLPKTKRRVEAHWQIDFFFFFRLRVGRILKKTAQEVFTGSRIPNFARNTIISSFFLILSKYAQEQTPRNVILQNSLRRNLFRAEQC